MQLCAIVVSAFIETTKFLPNAVIPNFLCSRHMGADAWGVRIATYHANVAIREAAWVRSLGIH
jgi:hypothetical protein